MMKLPRLAGGGRQKFVEMKNFCTYGVLGAPKSGQRFEPSAANWNMVEYVSFPVTLELSVLNTENKLSIYVIVS